MSCSASSTTRLCLRSTRDAIGDAIAEEVTALWQTDEVRSQRPRVVDEIRHGLWFFEQSLLGAAPTLVGELRERLPDASPLRFGSWIGGDQDGNPAAGPATIEEALARARELALTRYRAEVRELAAFLGSTITVVGASDELRRSIARDERELPAYAPGSARRTWTSPTGASSPSCGTGSARRSRGGPAATTRRRRSWPTSS